MTASATVPATPVLARATPRRFGLVLLAAGAFLVLAAAGYAFPRWLTFLLTMAAGNGLVSLGIVALMRGGVVPFGQGMVFATGGYTAGSTPEAWGISRDVGSNRAKQRFKEGFLANRLLVRNHCRKLNFHTLLTSNRLDPVRFNGTRLAKEKHMKYLFLIVTVTISFSATGCLVSERRGGGYGHYQQREVIHERTEVFVAAPQVVLRPPVVIVR
jgi:ABC-type branched-subunit amino acid transport system permease subunit